MSKILNRFLINKRTFPQFSQTYYHAYFWDLDHNYLAANDSMLSFLSLNFPHSQLLAEGYTLAEIMKDVLNASFSIEAVLENDYQVLKNEKTLIFTECGEIRNIKKNFLSIKSPLCNDSYILGLVGISFIVDNLSFADFNTLIASVSQLFSTDVSKETALKLFSRKSSQPPSLSLRERQCLQQYMRGYSAKDIAISLKLSHRTIESYLDNIKSKLGVNRRAELIPLAFKLFPELWN